MAGIGKVAERAESLQRHARLQVVEHPAGADAFGLSLDRDRDRIGREGLEESVYVRMTGSGETGISSVTNWPGW